MLMSQTYMLPCAFWYPVALERCTEGLMADHWAVRTRDVLASPVRMVPVEPDLADIPAMGHNVSLTMMPIAAPWCRGRLTWPTFLLCAQRFIHGDANCSALLQAEADLADIPAVCMTFHSR